MLLLASVARVVISMRSERVAYQSSELLRQNKKNKMKKNN